MPRGIGLLLLCGLTFVLGLGQPAITDSDEAFYAEAAREMVASGDWVTPHYDFEPRFQKPILYYWLTAAAYRAAGASEWTARLWSALSGVGLVLVTAHVALVAVGVLVAALGVGALAANQPIGQEALHLGVVPLAAGALVQQPVLAGAAHELLTQSRLNREALRGRDPRVDVEPDVIALECGALARAHDLESSFLISDEILRHLLIRKDED